MIKEIISPKWRDFQKSLASILNMTIVIFSAGKVVSIYNPFPPLSEIDLYPKLYQDYQAFFLNMSRFEKKVGRVEISYDPLGLPTAVIRLDMNSFLFLTGGFDQEQVPSPQAFIKCLEDYGVPEGGAEKLQKTIGAVSLEELKTKAASITTVYQQMVRSSSEGWETGQKMLLLTAVDEISKLMVGLFYPGEFDLTQIMDLVANSLIILCDADGAFISTCWRSDKQFFCRGIHEDFERSLQEQWEAVDAYDPASKCLWDGVKKDPDYGLTLHMTFFTRENARVCIGVVNPFLEDIQQILDALGRQVNIVMELSLLYELLQEQVGLLLNSIRHGVIAVNTEGKIMLINRAARNIFEPLGISLAIGQPLEEQGLCPSMVAAVQDKTATGSSHFLEEDTLTLKGNNQKIYLSWDVSPLNWKNGDIAGAILIIEDISARRIWEEEFLKVSKLESIGILAGGIAHDFNNFLATMLANISLAKLYGDNKKKLHEKLEGTEAAILRAKELTQQLFIFAKGSDPVKKTVNIEELIQESTNFALSGSSVFPEFIISGPLLPVEIDVGQINQVIDNIVINAVQAMPEGGKIRIRAENVNMEDPKNGHLVPLSEGKYVMFSFEDEGTGIPEKHLSKIFDPFFTTKARGSGLGLTTSYKIIQKHKGHINVQSVPGIGTTFSVYLPASNGAVQVQREETKFITGKGKILIMDDEVSIREITGEMLSYLGYEVDFAGDGMEALKLYKEEQEAGRPFDAVILDLTVPGGMGGQATMAQLLAMDPKVKAVVASGYSNDQVMAEYQDYGFIDILVKPFKMEELSRAMHSCLQS